MVHRRYFFPTDKTETGKRVKNVGQKARYYVYDSHEGIVSKEVYMKAVCEMNSRRRVIKYDDGTVETRKKYNGQNLLGNCWFVENVVRALEEERKEEKLFIDVR